MNTPIIPAAPSAAAPAPQQVEVTHKELVEKYRMLRERKEALTKQHAAILAPYTEAMTMIENVLHAALDASGSRSVRTEAGTFFKVERRSYTIDDPAAFRQYAESNNLMDLYENRVSKSALEELLSKGGALPPGIKVSSAITVNVRK